MTVATEVKMKQMSCKNKECLQECSHNGLHPMNDDYCNVVCGLSMSKCQEVLSCKGCSGGEGDFCEECISLSNEYSNEHLPKPVTYGDFAEELVDYGI